MILPKYFSGEGTLLDAGIDATHGDKNRASVVAFAIASVDPCSGASAGVSVFCAARIGASRKTAIKERNFIGLSAERVKFTISRGTRQLPSSSKVLSAFSEPQENRPLTPFFLETKQEGAVV